MNACYIVLRTVYYIVRECARCIVLLKRARRPLYYSAVAGFVTVVAG